MTDLYSQACRLFDQYSDERDKGNAGAAECIKAAAYELYQAYRAGKEVQSKTEGTEHGRQAGR